MNYVTSKTGSTPTSRVGTREEWLAATAELLRREKELTRLGDELARHLPQIATRNASASGTDLRGYFSQGHGISTFARECDSVYHCYSSYARGTEFLMGYYGILDRAPEGRDEGDQPMGWLHRHDEYRSE